MTNQEIIFDFLYKNRHSYCDDCIASLTDINPRNQVNQICNKATELIEKHKKLACFKCGKIKITRSIR